MRARTTGRTIRFSVPNAIHGKLSSRAAREGLTLSALLLRELANIVKRPAEAEMRKKLTGLSVQNRRRRV